MRLQRSVVLVLLVVLAAAACTSKSEERKQGVVEGGILRLGTVSAYNSLNPFQNFQQVGSSSFQYIYPYLVNYDENANFVGDFATDWKFSSDHTSVTFQTHSGGQWSDGTDVTAQDASYTLNLLLQYPGPTAIVGGHAAHIDSVEAPDDATLVVNYDAPVNEYWALSQLQQIPILPEHVWSNEEGEDGAGLSSFTNPTPIVSGGPFQMVNYQRRDIAQFVRNDGYYRSRPHIDGFGLKFYTNTDALIIALQNGELDATADLLPATAIEALRGNSNLELNEAPANYIDDLVINSHKPLHSELLNPQVREAFEYAIDRQQLVDVITLGHGAPLATIIPPATGEWQNPDIEPLPFDPAKANDILDSLGFSRGGDGIRVANGHKMEYEVITPDAVGGIDREFQIIQSGFEQIGVELHQRSLDPAATFEEIAGENFTSYDGFDLAIWDWFSFPDPDFQLSVLTCAQLGGWSDTGYCNKEYDKLYDEQAVTVDPDGRRAIVWQMQEMIAQDRPYIVLMTRNVLEARARTWEGFQSSAVGWFNPLSKATLSEVHRVTS